MLKGLMALLAALCLSGAGWAAQCNDGIDNDGDGLVDWQYDPGCTGPNDDSEGGRPSGSIENGWTVLEPSVDSRIVYVSADGSDSADGLTPATAKHTLAAGMALLRDGFPDWLLVRRGDQFAEGLGISISGRSATEPLVVDTCGTATARPVLTGAGIIISGSRLVVSGFELAGHGVDIGSAGADLHDVTVEDVRSTQAENSAVYTNGCSDCKVRRVMADRPNGNGIYVTSNHNLLIEDNVITEPNAHGMYITRIGNGDDITTRGNLVFMNGIPQNAIMQRPGGVSAGNVVVAAADNGISMNECNDEGGGPCLPPVPVHVFGNLFLDGAAPNGGGLYFSSTLTLPCAEARDNLFVRSASNGIFFSGDEVAATGNILFDASASLNGGDNVTWRDNVLLSDRSGILVYDSGVVGSSGFQALNNRYFSSVQPASQWFEISGSFAQWQIATAETGNAAPFGLPDTNRTLATYDASLGENGSGDEAFFDHALQHSKLDWNTGYEAASVIAYFRNGYRLSIFADGFESRGACSAAPTAH